MENNKKFFGAIGVVVIVFIIIYFLPKKDTSIQPGVDSNPTPTSTPIDNPIIPPVDKPKQNIYKDGTYNARGKYQSPAGSESINVSVTLKNDVISSATVTTIPPFSFPTSKYQGDFISGFQPLVIGKKIDEANLDFVSGSSLTPKGWNDALAQIKAEAKV